MIDRWAILVTCISDHYQYTGILTEQQISETSQIVTIDDVFNVLVSAFNNPQQEINKQNGSINLKKDNDGNMCLNYTMKTNTGGSIKFNFQQYSFENKENCKTFPNTINNSNQSQTTQDQNMDYRASTQCQNPQASNAQQYQNIRDTQTTYQSGNTQQSLNTSETMAKTLMSSNTQGSQQTQMTPKKEESLKRESKEGKFNLLHEGKEYNFKVTLSNQIPEFRIYLQNGTTWYYVENQQLNQNENGRYNPQYQNEQGIKANFDLNIIDEWAIELFCDFDYYCYVGILKEQEMEKSNIKIDDVFDHLDKYSKGPQQEINKQKGSIKLTKHEVSIIQLEQYLKVKKDTASYNLTQQWKLFIQKDFFFVEKKINDFQKYNTKVMEELLQIKQQNRELKLEIQQLKGQSKQENQQEQNTSIINDQILQLDTKLKEQQNTIEASQKLIMERLDTQNSFISKLNDHFFPKQIITKKLKPSELEKNNAQYRTYLLEGAGIFIFELKLKVQNQIGLSIGLNQTIIFQIPYYLIDISCEQQSIGLEGKNTTHFQYEPQVGDKIRFVVDLTSQKAILTADEVEITSMDLEKQEGTQLYLCVGRFKQNQEITDFME